MNKNIKQLQNLYSWNQFYQANHLKQQMRKCQGQISKLKKVINELKTKKR
tara:strand:- start:383 stop:532 length:150 start_codon:yes stop_codon:yes gene_type:complete